MSTLDPKGLRALLASVDSPHIHIGADKISIVADAIEIADSCARADIECNVEPIFPEVGPVTWYDLDNIDEYSGEPIDQAVRYLEARGLLDRHPKNPRHVKPRSAA